MAARRRSRKTPPRACRAGSFVLSGAKRLFVVARQERWSELGRRTFVAALRSPPSRSRRGPRSPRSSRGPRSGHDRRRRHAVTPRSTVAARRRPRSPRSPPGPRSPPLTRLARRTGVGQLFAGLLVDEAHRQADLAALVDLEELDLHFLAFGQTSRTFSTRSFLISETWTSPSLPPMKFTNAPKSTMLTTLPV